LTVFEFLGKRPKLSPKEVKRLMKKKKKKGKA
jgi:hypothetical protein